MTENRKDCPMRHENGNCTVAGGFCTAVNDPICEALHNAFECGYRSALRVQQEPNDWICTLKCTALMEEGMCSHGGLCCLYESQRTIKENEPLTLDELRKMDGEPVWIVEEPDWGHWELSVDAEDYLADRDECFYGMKHDDPDGRYGLHKLGWLAYCQKPEERTV